MTTFSTTREIPAPPEQVFAAFSDPARLARWWGPAGFTNTFTLCEFTPGGLWSFVMHGPDEGNYANESTFAAIDPPRQVVIQHISEPRFLLTVTLEASAAGTSLCWTQAFENADVAERVRHIVVPSNEQNLDRLTAEVLANPGS